MTKIKLWQKSNCEKTQIVTKLKLWEKNQKLKRDKTQIVTVVTVVTKKLLSKQNLKKKFNK